MELGDLSNRILYRAGITRDLFKLGDPVTVVCYRAKDGTQAFGYLKEMTLSSGRKIAFDNGQPPSRRPRLSCRQVVDVRARMILSHLVRGSSREPVTEESE